MYEIFQRLCDEHGVTAYKVCKETGITTASISNWKAGRYKPKQDKLQKIAEYFGVPVEYLITGKEEDSEQKITSLSKSEELDIMKDVDVIMDKLNKGEDVVLRFNGAGAKDEGRELLRQSLLNTCRTAKLISKQKE